MKLERPDELSVERRSREQGENVFEEDSRLGEVLVLPQGRLERVAERGKLFSCGRVGHDVRDGGSRVGVVVEERDNERHGEVGW